MAFLQSVDAGFALNVVIALGMGLNFLVSLSTKLAVADLKAWVMDFVEQRIQETTSQLRERQHDFDARLRHLEIRCAGIARPKESQVCD